MSKADPFEASDAPEPDTTPGELDPTAGQEAHQGLLWRIIGPPWEALKRVWAAVSDRLAEVLARVLSFWRFLFLGPEKDANGELPRPPKTAMLLASVVLALIMYSWPLRDIVPVWIFIPLAVVVLVAAFRTIQYISLRGSGSGWEKWLRQTERRAGLVWWERLGLLLAAAGAVAAVLLAPSVLPLAGGAVLGFLILLGQPPDRRELETVRVVVPLPPPTDPAPDADDEEAQAQRGYVRRVFDWQVPQLSRTDSHHLGLWIHEPTYQTVKAQNPGTKWEEDTPQFDDYVVDGNVPDIERACAALDAIFREHNYSSHQSISTVLAFVQAIPYSYDKDSVGARDYWRYPIETLYDRTGDCEDSSILAAAVLRRLGYPVVMLRMPDHAAIGVEAPPGLSGSFVEHGGRRWYFCETTSSGWRVGNLPSDVSGSTIQVIPVPDYR